MKNISYVKTAILSSIFGALVMVGTATVANAQYSVREYQRAQIEAQQRRADWERTRSQKDWRQWQKAQAKVARMQSMYGNGYYTNNGNHYGWSNPQNPHYNGNYNAGYTNYGISESQARQAVNNGYAQGYRQGQVDRRYNRQSSYYSTNNAYGNSQYQYYYEQGFRRGYEDGYNSRSTYGYRSGNSYNVLSSVLGTILNMAANR